MAFQNQPIRLIRQKLAEKTRFDPKDLIMFYGDDLILHDDMTLGDANMANFGEIDAFYYGHPLKKEYEDGSDLVVRFKCRTSDRTGRSAAYIYVRRTSPMMEVRDQYAQEQDLNPELVSLRFDGDLINLQSTPEMNDLEGDECLDAVVRQDSTETTGFGSFS
jgi:hypothetical protein